MSITAKTEQVKADFVKEEQLTKRRKGRDVETGASMPPLLIQGKYFMTQSCSTSGFATQADKIEHLLRSRYGVWIPAYELADVALQYCARINAIRKKLRAAGDTEEIQNKTERVRGRVHGSYRVCQKAPVSSLSAEEPSRSWEQVVAEREEKTRKPEPEWSLTP